MRTCLLTAAGLLLAGAMALCADQGRPNLTGTWKLDPARSEAGPNQDLVLSIQEKDENIQLQETRGPKQDDVSKFTCGTLGKQCPMDDGGHKADVSVYYNGPVLIVLKTNGRRGSTVEKLRLSLSPAGDALLEDVIPIQPEGKTEKLVFIRRP